MKAERKQETEPAAEKLSAIIVRMARIAAHGAPLDLTNGAHLYALELAQAAWNKEVGSGADLQSIRSAGDDIRERMGHLMEDPMGIIERAIQELRAYKQTHHEADKRRILRTTPTKGGQVRVDWRDAELERHSDRIKPKKAGKPRGHAGSRHGRMQGPGIGEAYRFGRRPVSEDVIARARARAAVRDRIVPMAEANPTLTDMIRDGLAHLGGPDEHGLRTETEIPPGLAVLHFASNRSSEILSMLHMCTELRPLVMVFHEGQDRWRIKSGGRGDLDRIGYAQWLFQDHPIGADGETWFECLANVCEGLDVRNDYTALLRKMAQTHPQVVTVRKNYANGTCDVRDVLTGETFRALVWLGEEHTATVGTTWRLRAYPDPTNPKGPRIAGAMPEILTAGAKAWGAHLRKVVDGKRGDPRRKAYRSYMQAGDRIGFWPEFLRKHRKGRNGLMAKIHGLPEPTNP